LKAECGKKQERIVGQAHGGKNRIKKEQSPYHTETRPVYGLVGRAIVNDSLKTYGRSTAVLNSLVVWNVISGLLRFSRSSIYALGAMNTGLSSLS